MPKTSKTKTTMDDGKPYATKPKDDNEPIAKTKSDAKAESGKTKSDAKAESGKAKKTLDDAKPDNPEATMPKTGDEETAKAKTEKDTESDDEESDTKKCPLTKAEMKKIEKMVGKMFVAEKKEARLTGGMITCALTGNEVCFCNCGPHLVCPEHNLNCCMYWNGMYPADLDPLVLRWLKWRME
jgi:hypothetical protein